MHFKPLCNVSGQSDVCNVLAEPARQCPGNDIDARNFPIAAPIEPKVLFRLEIQFIHWTQYGEKTMSLLLQLLPHLVEGLCRCGVDSSA